MLQMEAWRPTVTRAPMSAINQRVPDPFEQLFLQEYPKVVAIAYRVLGDRPAAEDVAHGVFIQFHPSYSPTSERAPTPPTCATRRGRRWPARSGWARKPSSGGRCAAR